MLAVGLAGCASVVVSNYRPGTLVSATVGYPLVEVGLEYKNLSGGPPSPVRQLIYGGRSGDTVKLTYRQWHFSEWRSDAQTQELQFDLSRSNKITFQEMRLEVIEATGERITANVLSPAREDSRGLPLEPGQL